MNEICKLCGINIAAKIDLIDGKLIPITAVYSKDKNRKYYLCDYCKRIFVKTRNQVLKFIEADVFWSE